ncbi:hypothetical protein BKA69DRAFT_1098687 [Paraphysoderma sedebokerense]|nr:hypothetical protein BKA69DRAFT_1098687 [Paraphysoderma sedebokerense]
MSPLLLGGVAVLYFLIARMIRVLYQQFRRSLVRNSDKTEFQQLGRVLHTLLNILYVHVTTSSLSLFDCYQSPDGHHYLEADSSLRCYEAWYVQDMPYAILGTCIYVVGIPLYFSAVYFILHQTWYTSKFWQKSKQTLEELMTFDKNYKREYQFYGVLQLYHKLAVIMVNVFLTRYASIQIVFTVGLLLIWLQLFILYRPYIHDTLNRLEVLSHISIILVLGAGLPFRFNELVSGSSLQKFFVVFIIFIICGFIILVLVVALGEVWGKLGCLKGSHQKTENHSKNMYQSSVQILLPTKP